MLESFSRTPSNIRSGLNENLLRAILRKGFKQPTPIQRKTIPLVLQRKDVVGMARTGSGKTAAFVIPMIERLKAHSAKVGARALILSPSRELALQTLKVVKELGKGTDLKSVLLVGGDSLEEQFGFMTTNPDIIIATPGRFLHLKVEMSLSLSSIQYVVFDEADRLFEMGFAEQLAEILHALPLSRQTLLFSATLPKSLVDFARAGLQDPSLVRLDAETKVSPDLESAFFGVKGGEKEAALLHILHDVIKVPLGIPEGAQEEQDKFSKKRKRGYENPNPVDKPTEHSTIVFAATKHHVEYLGAILREQGFAVSYVYGSLDQTARKIQVENFRRGRTNILVVTDVAARGIDIPILANVINYDFPPQPKVFVHRVGRTARAGKKGWSYSILQDSDVPYLLDLQLFLDRRLVLGRQGEPPSYTTDMATGALQRAEVSLQVEWLNKLFKENEDINTLRKVAAKAEKLYIKTRTSASSQSAKRAKEVIVSNGWNQLHPIFGEIDDEAEQARNDMLARISNWKPKETIFEVSMGKKLVSNSGAEVMREIRKRITPKNRVEKPDTDETKDLDLIDTPATKKFSSEDDGSDEEMADVNDDPSALDSDEGDDGNDSDSELEVTVSKHSTSKSNDKKDSAPWKDPEFFMSYTPRTINVNEDKGYSVHNGVGGSGASFVEATRDATMDLTNDDSAKAFGAPARPKTRWDKKQNKFVNTANDADGSRGEKSRMIRGESGVKIAASFQSGRFDRWRRAHRLGKLPHVGEAERPGVARLAQGHPGAGGGDGAWRHFKHKQERAPKEADKYRDDYHVRKKRVAEAKEKRIGKFKDGEGSRREIKGVEDIRKARKIEERKKQKNARPTKKGKR